ncbi:hypothetical protein [Bailinhaonella thermotolerans]|uniref:Uncharacterized protein n=1 Tax=Bailinhaonella thermotolerans TaxID=1070861 RepID=A0A3A4AMA2_9ACTN|nr:hypothetical protein [Bailinhaonella thermotolerans]RJL20188.1 hypothetical protein D5H75_39770 [Bailinhaonella thermotolerans]
MTEFYTLLTSPAPPGTVLDAARFVTADPRHLPVIDITCPAPGWSAADILEPDRSPLRLVRVEPLSPPHPDQWERDGQVVTSPVLVVADAWRVAEGLPDLDPILGPQARQVRAAIAAGQALLLDDGDGPTATAYHQGIEAQDTETVGRHERAAKDALGPHADTLWMDELGGDVYAPVLVALAARHLIGTTPAWTQEAYDYLTRPWRSVPDLPPLHPSDAPVPASATPTEGPR